MKQTLQGWPLLFIVAAWPSAIQKKTRNRLLSVMRVELTPSRSGRSLGRLHSPTRTNGVKPFVMLPWAVLYDDNLSARAKLLYAAVLSHCPNEGGEAWPSRQRLAGILGCSENNVRLYMAELAEANLIEVKARPGRVSLYTVADPTCNTPTPMSVAHAKQVGTPLETRGDPTCNTPRTILKNETKELSRDRSPDPCDLASLGFTWNTTWKPPRDCKRDQQIAVFTIADLWSARVQRINTLSSALAGTILRRLKDGYTRDQMLMAIEAYAGTEWIRGGKQPKAARSFFQPELIDRELARDAKKSAFGEKREGDYQEAALRRREEREENKEAYADHLKAVEALAALSPKQFEEIKAAAFKRLPEGLRSTIPEGSDPLEHGSWKSLMVLEHKQRNAIEAFEGRLRTSDTTG